MNTPTPIDDPAHWRQLTEEARRMTDQLADPETKQMMLEIAASYEELASIAEALPFGISSLGPWQGSKEGEVANLKPHYRAMLEDTGFVVVRRRAVEFRTEGD
jgi:hypothetical protein